MLLSTLPPLQVSLLTYTDDGQLDVSSVIPLIDGVTEGEDDVIVDDVMMTSCVS